VLGNPETAKVSLVVFTNFESDKCKLASRVYKRLKQAYGDDLMLVYRAHTKGGSDGNLAALAAATATKLHNFWSFHDVVFSYGDSTFHPGTMEESMRKLGINVPKEAIPVLYSDDTEARVQADDLLAHINGITAEPTFFINGRKLEGLQSYEVMDRMIKEELARASQAIKAGMAPEAARNKMAQSNFKAVEPTTERFVP
jgi:protein-disulfide isomerase